MDMEVSQVHGGDWASPGVMEYVQGQQLLDLSSSISPYGPGPRARTLWPSLVDRIDRYPDWRAFEATKTAAAHLRVEEHQVLMTAGGVEAIDLVLQSFAPPRVFVKVPAFSEYRDRAEIRGIPVHSVSGAGDLSGQQGLLFVANPANPTGEVLRPQEMAPYLEWAQQPGAAMVVDEAFLEFLQNWRELTVTLQAAGNPHLVVIGSLTKFYGLAGLRVGYIVATRAHIEAAASASVPWHVSLVAQDMATACLQDQTYFAQTRCLLDAERERLTGLLAPLGRVRKGAEANYLLFSPHGACLDEVLHGLNKRAILVRDARTFEGLDGPYVRIAVKRPEDSDRLVRALQEVYAGK